MFDISMMRIPNCSLDTPTDNLFPSTIASRNFPPHNLYATPNNEVLVYVLAVAGYQHSDLELNIHDEKELILIGKPKSSLLGLDPTGDPFSGESKKCLRTGIKNSEFIWHVTLPKNYQIKKAKLDNGLMWIRLEMVEKTKKSVKIEF